MSIVMSIVTADECDTAFVVNRTRIGSNAFLGERIPPRALCRTESSHDDRHSLRPHHLGHS